MLSGKFVTTGGGKKSLSMDLGQGLAKDKGEICI
jgi:hypothetical protein